MVRTTLEELLFDEATNEAIRGTLPEPAVAFFGLVTHLGDGAVLVGLMAAMYWFGAPSRRRTRALVLAIGLLALAVSAGLKGIVDAPRPDVAFGYGMYSPYSFPSAHALGAAAVYGAIAAFGELGTKRLRYAIAGSVIVLVALSRVVVGAHFAGDVLAGVVLGLGIVALVVRFRPEPTALFALAGAVAVVSFAFGSTHYTTITTGAAIGATIVWPYVGRQSWQPRGASLFVFVVCLLPVLAVLRAVTVGWDFHWVVDIGAYALVMGGTVLVPGIAARLNDWESVTRLQATLPFSGRTVDPKQMPPTKK